MSQKRMIGRGLIIAGLSCVLGMLSDVSFAGISESSFTLGSPNVVVADPSVLRTSSTPCVVTLLQDATFTDAKPRTYSYTPPTGSCVGHSPGYGPWAQVVLEADFSVTAGHQDSRTATLWLGGVNLFFGTTAKPSATVAPSWHVERDLTDYIPLLLNPQQGQAIIDNAVDAIHTGVIHGSARLVFYPTSNSAISTPADAIYPLGADAVGNTATLNNATDQLTKTLTLPRNITGAFLDVYAQSQGHDELWYTCVPDQYVQQTGACGGGSFREVEVSIDGQPAGLAPIYPWVYADGIDPYLWQPTAGVQALNFMPYRVDLTPFAGLLSNGAPHEVAVSVAGAHNHFSAAATLLIYLDPFQEQVTGQITRNTLVGQPLTPTITSTLSDDGHGNLSGNITTGIERQFVIAGYINSPQLGTVTSAVTQTMKFSNTQSFVINATTRHQTTQQLTTSDSGTNDAVSEGAFVFTKHVDYPLQVDSNRQIAADGSSTVANKVLLDYNNYITSFFPVTNPYFGSVHNDVVAADTLMYDKRGHLSGHTGQNSHQSFRFLNAYQENGGCYETNIASDNGVLSAYTDSTNINSACYETGPPYQYGNADGSPSDMSDRNLL